VRKQAAQKFDVERFNPRKLNKQYQNKISHSLQLWRKVIARTYIGLGRTGKRI
jgi:hypothetical protein